MVVNKKMQGTILGATLLLGSCITCTQQVQQRESQAGEMRDVTDAEKEDSKEVRETELDLQVPVAVKP